MLSPPLSLTLAPTFLTQDHQLCKVYPSSDHTHISDSLVPASEEQDSSPLAPSGNHEETADSHTNAPPSVEDDIHDDHSLHLDTNSPKEQPTRPVIEERDSSPPAPSGNHEETADNHMNTPPSAEGDIGNAFSLHLDINSPKEQPTHPGIEEQATITSPIGVIMRDEPKENVTDLLLRTRGLYRLLDLISEQGSGGAGMVNILSRYVIETQPTVITKWTKSSSLKSPWRSLWTISAQVPAPP